MGKIRQKGVWGNREDEGEGWREHGDTGGSGRRMEAMWGHGEDRGEASHSSNELFQLSPMAHGEALCDGDGSNLCVPRGPGRRNSADATAEKAQSFL